MKKFASMATSLMLAAMMIVSSVSTAFAVTYEQTDAPKVGTDGVINITKTDTTDAKNPVKGAEFTAYKVLDFDGTYSVNADFNGVVEVKDLIHSSDDKVTGTYGTTTELEAQITKLVNHVYYDNVEFKTAPTSDTTDTDGLASIENLSYGVYLVIETKVPNDDTDKETQYNDASQPFLVAIPYWDNEYKNDTGEKVGAWQTEVNATPKNKAITIDKKMSSTNNVGADGKKTEQDADSYSIGDTIDYTIMMDIPDYGTAQDFQNKSAIETLLIQNYDKNAGSVAGMYLKGVEKLNALDLTISDVMSKGLTLDTNSIKLDVVDANGDKVLDAKGNEINLTGAEDANLDIGNLTSTVLGRLESYTVDNNEVTEFNRAQTNDNKTNDYVYKISQISPNTNPEGTTMNIQVAFASIYENKLQGCKLKLTYSAQLNGDAEVTQANSNTVKYEFSNKPNTTARKNVEDKNEVYTYEMDLTKLLNGEPADKFADADKAKFASVTFTMTGPSGTNINDNLAEMKFVEISAGNYYVWTEGDNKDITTIKEIHPSQNGTLNIKGLEAGTYTLTETASANGYSKLGSPITIVVEEVPVDGKLTGAVSAKYTIKDNDAGVVLETVMDSNNKATGVFKISINNPESQFTLPVTGGAGLWMFTICAGVILAIAIILFANAKKKKTNKKAE